MKKMEKNLNCCLNHCHSLTRGDAFSSVSLHASLSVSACEIASFVNESHRQLFKVIAEQQQLVEVELMKIRQQLLG